MARLRYRTRIDLGVSAVTITVGAFFLYQVSIIESVQTDAIGPNLIPFFLATSMIVLGVLVGLSALYYNSNQAAATATDALHSAEPDEDFGFRDSDMVRVVAVVVMGFVYIGLFWASGYIISTFLSLVLMLLVFGNRQLATIVVLSVAGALVYNYIFMGLMGLHDPPGAYLDLERFLEDPSWKELTRKLAF
ncbi:MAG: tripartite tricarboxylate transporter TctB family protein [Hyphomicrobiaceae bacterium]